MAGSTEEASRRKVERRNRILAYVKTNGAQETAVLSKHFKVSSVTIRMDVNALVAQGFLRRSFGGVETSDFHLVIKAYNSYMQLPSSCRSEDKIKAGDRLAQSVRKYLESTRNSG